jgi:hypothetical protein
MSDLTPLFAPKSVAVLGVSRNPARLGHRLLQNVKDSGFAGAIHPVNRSGEPIPLAEEHEAPLQHAVERQGRRANPYRAAARGGARGYSLRRGTFAFA